MPGVTNIDAEASSEVFGDALSFMDLHTAQLKGVLMFKFAEFFTNMPDKVKYFGMSVQKSQVMTFLSTTVAQMPEFLKISQFHADSPGKILIQSSVMLLETPNYAAMQPGPEDSRVKFYHVFLTVNNVSKPINSTFVVSIDLDKTNDGFVHALEFRLAE